MGNYTLKKGVIIQPYGINSLLTDKNITDEIAELLIKKGRAKKEDFIIKQINKNKK